MNDIFKEHIKDFCNLVNGYVVSKSEDDLKLIKHSFQKIFEIDSVMFYQINSENKMYVLDNSDKKNLLPVENSLIAQAIKSKKVIIENHPTSNKYFNADIDNPFGYKIKGLLVVPVFANKKAIGVALFYRFIGNKIVFNVANEKDIKKLSPIIAALFTKDQIDKNFHLKFVEVPSKNVKQKVILSKEHSKKDTTLEIKKIYEKKNELSDIEIKYNEYKSKTEKEISELQKINKEYEDARKVDSDEIATLKNKLLEVEKVNKELETKLLVYTKMNSEYTIDLEKITKNNESLKTKNIELEENILKFKKEKEKVENSISIQNEKIIILEKNNASLLQSKTLLERKHIENENNVSDIIIKNSRGLLGSNHYSRVFFELIVYAMYSENGLNVLEDEFIASDILKKVLDKYSLRQTVQVNIEKTKVSNIIVAIHKYESLIFQEKIKINIVSDADIPPSIYIDSQKIESIILHLLLDLYDFVNNEYNIDINIKYINKNLFIRMDSIVHEKNSMFRSMLKKGTIFGNENDRVSLEFSKKLLNTLNGTLSKKHEGNSYTYELAIPAPIIKL